MERPYLVYLYSFKTENALSLKGLIGVKHIQALLKENLVPQAPLAAYSFFKKVTFSLHFRFFKQNGELIAHRLIETNSMGEFQTKLFLENVDYFEVHETDYLVRHQCFLGRFMPILLPKDFKLVICDFDKTLVETKYSTFKEVYRSMTTPVFKFPTLVNSVTLLNQKITNGFLPAIISAGPHFYNDTIVNWCQLNNLSPIAILLKDYRKILSFESFDIVFKDIKKQGFYKLNHLIKFVLLTDIPTDLVLIGDAFESDPVIYLAFTDILKNNQNPVSFVNHLKTISHFPMNKKQKTLLIQHIQTLNEKIQQKEMRGEMNRKKMNIEIFIRLSHPEQVMHIPKEFKSGHRELIQTYLA